MFFRSRPDSPRPARRRPTCRLLVEQLEDRCCPSGAYLADFVTVGSGGLDTPILMTFTDTDPVTLAYTGDHLLADAARLPAGTESLHASQVQPFLAEAERRWQLAGADTTTLQGIAIRIAELGGRTLGLADEVHHTIWLDDNAAGWGWFVDKTPWNDSEFTLPGNQGEQHRMDLLTVLDHELGHMLGYEHSQTGVMRDTLPAGTRRTPATSGTNRTAAHPLPLVSTRPTAWSDTFATDLLFALLDPESHGGKRRR
jgi:hypothetical protein